MGKEDIEGTTELKSEDIFGVSLKIELYRRVSLMFAEAMKATSKTAHRIASTLTAVNSELIILGSDDVINAFGKWLTISRGSNLGPEAVVSALIDVMVAMRKDIQPGTTVSTAEIMKQFVSQ